MVATLRITTETKGERVRRLLCELVDTSYLCALFRRSDLTIALWRKRKGLPVVRIPGHRRDTIRFDKSEVMDWAITNNIRIFPVESPVEAGVRGGN
jgi:hypothetical protein